ncbi:hypothetical protein AB5J62_09525 [Amycolatopsis sp. cg5]|uniref:hypothetical protein n=1 Tax=Amycolatopsis sp. cg5 TaxID=3238802 RepID=UPI00352690FB
MSDLKPTITEQQANGKVEQYIAGALTALPPAGKILFARNRPECTDPTDKGPRGRYEISASYEITGLDPAQYPGYFDAIVRWWTTHDFDVLADHRPKDTYVFARNKTDAFDMSFESNDLGKLYVGATSPCVWPDGNPPPRAESVPESSLPPVAAPEPHPAKAEPARRSRPKPVDEEVEDFDQIDWTEEGS